MSMDADVFADIARAVHQHAGLHFGAEKRYLFESRLRPVLQRLGLPSFQALRDALCRGGTPEVRTAVVQALVTHETSFFRDRAVFEHLEKRLLPELGGRRRGPLRLWSAATSTGQEAWTLAIILHRLRARDPALRGEIVATDLSEAALARARAGRYTTFEVQRGLTARELVEHFERDGEDWRVRAHLRDYVRFRRHNLLDPPTALGGPFDVVLVRNVLIYMEPPVRIRILRGIVRVLGDAGVLVLGASELPPAGLSLRPDGGASGVYRLLREGAVQGPEKSPRRETGRASMART